MSGAVLPILQSLGVGLAVGVVFAALKLPIPAPPTIAGIIGIVGIWAGMVVVTYFSKFL